MSGQEYEAIDSSPSTPAHTRPSTPVAELDEDDVVANGEDQVNSFVWLLVSAAAVSGMLFGYDTGVISGTLVIIREDLGEILSDKQKELITSATTLGALIGGLVAGALSDVIGRKPVIAVASVIFIGGAVGQAVCHTVSAMVGGRFIIGLGVGLASCVVPLYIGELAPTKIRGRLVTINVVAITLGQVFAYAIGAAFMHVSNGWRYMVGLGAAPAIIQLVALLFLPESPRIMLRRGQKDPARRILAKIYPLATPPQIERKIKVMDAAVKHSTAVQNTSFKNRIASFKVGSNRRALIVGCALQASQQLCGFNTLMYFSATLFAMIGFKNPTAVGLIIAGVNFIFTLFALRIVDPFGRRRTMLWTIPVMVIALALAAVSFHYLTLKTGGQLEENAEYSSTWSALVLVAMVIYVAGYATGLGNIPWQQGELFRLEVRGIGTSICTATNWSCNLLISATFLSLMRAATPAGAFGLFSVLCALAWVFTYFRYPETAGLSLEEVCALFEDDFGVGRIVH